MTRGKRQVTRRRALTPSSLMHSSPPRLKLLQPSHVEPSRYWRLSSSWGPTLGRSLSPRTSWYRVFWRALIRGHILLRDLNLSGSKCKFFQPRSRQITVVNVFKIYHIIFNLIQHFLYIKWYDESQVANHYQNSIRWPLAEITEH